MKRITAHIQYLAGFLLCCLMIASAGCSTTSRSVDIGTVVNANKQVEEIMPVPPITAYKAAIAAFRELNMPIIAEFSDEASMGIKSRFADRAVAWVDITSTAANSCRVTVSVDVFSDESRSKAILAAIERNLPNGNASESPQTGEQVKQPDVANSGSSQQPEQSDQSEVYPEQLKPLPKEEIKEKSLL